MKSKSKIKIFIVVSLIALALVFGFVLGCASRPQTPENGNSDGDKTENVITPDDDPDDPEDPENPNNPNEGGETDPDDGETPDDNIVSLYCWDINDFNLSRLKIEVEYLGINTLYIQKPSTASETERLKQIVDFSEAHNLDLFLMDGGADWLTTGDIDKVKSLIRLADELNETLDYKIKGVSLDVEFYTDPSYDTLTTAEKVDAFRTFTAKTKECCDYANSFGLGYSMALPVWLDKLSKAVLEDLMNYHYDHIAFMNYYKPTIMENLDEEVEIARKHDIKIVTIAEVQSTDYVGETDTFYNDGLESCINTLSAIKDKYDYEKLGTSFHYYKPLVELLQRDTDSNIENAYELELYTYLGDDSVRVDEATIVGADNLPAPIHGYYSQYGEYVLNLYGLEFGKEYTVTVRLGEVAATKTFIYQNGDLGKSGIAYKSITIKG